VLHLVLLVAALQGGATCPNVDECRKQATEAADRGDFETFHDLAWRAVQKGKPNDPALMYLLARAQSLSGRPGDALVMLQRLRELGITTDAATNDDFRFVRALKGWAEFAETSPPAAAPPAPPSAPVAPSPAPPPAPSSPPTPSAAPTTALTFDARSLDPVGLAYDAVSRRFLIGDRTGGRLIVIDEVSHHAVNLVSAASADFLARISGFAIDAKRGDLWVASTDERESAVHKLQLVSGRVLTKVVTHGEGEPVRFEDLVVAADGTVFAVDAAGGRLFRLSPGAREFEMAQKIGTTGTRALAHANGNTFFVGTDTALLRVDLGRRGASSLSAPKGAALGHIGRLRWHGGSLLAMQQTSSGPRLIRLTLDDEGKAVKRLDVVDDDVASETAGALSGETFFYLARNGTIRSLILQ
jgi:sugar lactone lactonase YvrE